MRGFVIFLGLLLVLGGGAAAGAQFAPIDLSTISIFDSLPGAREFLTSQMALYAGGGAAGFGLLLIIIAAATGRRKQVRPVMKSPSLAAEMSAPRKAAPTSAPPKAAPQPDAPPAPMPAPPPPKPVLSPAPVGAAAPAPLPDPAKAKPQASGQPPAGAVTANSPPPPDPRLINRKRVQDLVTINDALKNFHAKTAAYPKAEGLVGANERGADWIPGLAPDYLAALPRDPLHGAATQYVYVSDGANYKLLAQGASLVGSGNVEVLGIRIDQTRNPTPQSASYGFWTPPFAGA